MRGQQAKWAAEKVARRKINWFGGGLSRSARIGHKNRKQIPPGRFQKADIERITPMILLILYNGSCKVMASHGGNPPPKRFFMNSYTCVCPGIPTTIKTMGFNISTIAYLSNHRTWANHYFKGGGSPGCGHLLMISADISWATKPQLLMWFVAFMQAQPSHGNRLTPTKLNPRVAAMRTGQPIPSAATADHKSWHLGVIYIWAMKNHLLFRDV